MEDHYQAMIDYELTFDQMIEIGHYDDVHRIDVTRKHFPIIGKGKREAMIKLFPNSFNNKPIDLDAVTSLMRQTGYHPGKIEELLALGATFPDLRLPLSIASHASQWRFKSGCIVSPCLNSLATGRVLFVTTVSGREWIPRYLIGVHESTIERNRVPIVITTKHPWLSDLRSLFRIQ